MQHKTFISSELDICSEETNAFASLPDYLRPHAEAMLSRFMNDSDTWALSQQDIVSAILSPSFRPVLEQEATLSAPEHRGPMS